MPRSLSLKRLLDALQSDADFRAGTPLSEDIQVANGVLIDRDAYPSEREKVLSLWLQGRQPCMFGRLAAKTNQVHFCILTPDDLEKSDAFIKEKISREVKLYKHRALDGRPESPHGFILLAAHEKLVFAKPDENLKAFALKLRSLWDIQVTTDTEGNDVAFDDLYLRNPFTDEYYKFIFNADFFATAGDGRWWHDHRMPGGLAFSANSLGHMLRHKQWYEDKEEIETTKWGLRLAMHTIASGANVATKEGAATFLLDLNRGRPMKPLSCPFAAQDALPAPVRDKDWTTYGGYYHTDHSVRDELFADRGGPVTETRPFSLDFSYIYNPVDVDYVGLIAGQLVSKNEIDAKIGSEFTRRRLTPNRSRSRNVAARIAATIERCTDWALTDEESNILLNA